MRPRKYFCATMFVAVCDQNLGNSTPFCSKAGLSLPGLLAHRGVSRGSLVRGNRRKDRRGRRYFLRTVMTLGRPISWAPLTAALALALSAGAGAARPAALCVVVDPLLDVGCHDADAG